MVNKSNATVKAEHNMLPEGKWIPQLRAKHLKHNNSFQVKLRSTGKA